MMNLMVQYQAASRAATARSRRPSGCPTRSSGTACRGMSWSTLSRSTISAMAAPPGGHRGAVRHLRRSRRHAALQNGAGL